MSETTSEAKVLQIPSIIGVGEFAQKLSLPVTKIIGELMKNGVMATINEQIDFDTAVIIGSDLGFTIEPEVAAETPMKDARKIVLPKGEGVVRPPIVAVMGHVDHGKTSLLDAVRKANVVAGEAGGITQHIGAYQVKRNDRWITFLDTPGHEAFSALRAHGARMTDVAIIVVAADDGVKPQTREAVRYAREAGVQMVIAINKVDKEGADSNRVRQELSELELIPEEWGGKTVMVDVSAKSGENIDKLLDMVLLVADIEDLRAHDKGLSNGTIIESHMETGRGPVATLLVQNGELNVGDYITAGSTYAKIRSLEDWHGKRIKKASAGMPALVTGFKAVPAFGDYFEELENEKQAREKAIASTRSASFKSMVKVKKIDASELTNAITAGNISELNVIVKADAQGSLESLMENIGEIKNDEVAVKVVSSGVGDISENDVNFAKTAGAMLVGFNTSINSTVKQLATREGVQIRLYKVIYELLDDLRDALGQMLKPEIVETEMGILKILGVFKTTKAAVVCGGEVTKGKVEPDALVRIKRGGEVIGQGTVASLQKEQNVVREVVEGEQCGMNIALKSPTKIEEGDRLEFYTVSEHQRTL